MKTKFSAAGLTRRDFLKYGIFAAGGVLAADGVFFEPRNLRVERVEVAINGLAPEFDGFAVCQVTDVHHSIYIGIDYVRHAVGVANSLKPDLVVMTGDYINQDMYRLPPVMEALALLRARHGVLAVLGNHDYAGGKRFAGDAARAAGIPLLDNGHRLIERGRAALCVAGTSDFMQDDPDAGAALKGVAGDVPRILLTHHPDYAELLPKGERVDLVLSGHTHGGQVRLPFGFAPVVLSSYGQKYRGGLVRLDRAEGTQVYVSRGLGVVILPVRFNCPPELTLITLRTGPRGKGAAA